MKWFVPKIMRPCEDCSSVEWNSNNNFVALNYTRIYMNVAYANEYLRETTDEKLGNRGVGDELRAKIEGFRAEARVLRAMSYYFLMDLYANVPFIDETVPVGSRKLDQKDRVFFFSSIESELKNVEEKLPPG